MTVSDQTTSEKSVSDQTASDQTASAKTDETHDTESAAHGVIMTDAASAKAKALLDQEGRDDLGLRIAVQPGGCAGLRYNLFFDDRALDGDLSVDLAGWR